jgi:acylphosphatase
VDQVQVHVRWEGRVQGVGFRALVQSVCSRNGLVGWVRNQADGSVEAILAGAPDRVDTAIDAIANARGPTLQATRRRSLELGSTAIPNTFEIRR